MISIEDKKTREQQPKDGGKKEKTKQRWGGLVIAFWGSDWTERDLLMNGMMKGYIRTMLMTMATR